MAGPSPTRAGRRDSEHVTSEGLREDHERTVRKVASSSMLQPRVAVVLNVPQRWHPFLFICRLLPTLPALWCGVRYVLRFVVTDLVRYYGEEGIGDLGVPDRATNGNARMHGAELADEAARRLRYIAMGLSILWCGASAYLAYFFTDCLMSRWLLNYTPQATLIRLLALSSIFLYISSWTVYLLGGNLDPSLLLPAWILIATTLTACYHFTQRKINIRKETSASISVFGIASFISMVALLMHLGLNRIGLGYGPDIPLVKTVRRMVKITKWVVKKALEVERERERDGL